MALQMFALPKQGCTTMSQLTTQTGFFYFIADTEAEMPSQNLHYGDLLFAKDTEKLYRRCTSGWEEVGGGAPGEATVSEPATFYAVYDRIAPAQNKYLATLFNTSATRKVVVYRVWLLNWQAAAVTGVLLETELRKITAQTAGTGVTPVASDSDDTLSAGITANHNSSNVSDSTVWRRAFTASEETKIGALTLENLRSVGNSDLNLIYHKEPGLKGITLRQNQGLSVKQITNSTVGTVSVVIEFSDEAA